MLLEIFNGLLVGGLAFETEDLNSVFDGLFLLNEVLQFGFDDLRDFFWLCASNVQPFENFFL